MKTIIILTVLAVAAMIKYVLANRKKVTDKKTTPQDPLATTIYHDRTRPGLTNEDWKSKFESAGLEHHWKRFEGLLRDEVRMSTRGVPEAEIKLGQSKIGGHPDLPRDQSWFSEDNGKSLSFVAQINLSETKPFDVSDHLPQRGILYFFYSAEQEAWGFDPKDKDKFKVFYFDGDTTQLERLEVPTDLPEHALFRSCKVSFTSAVSLPSWESDSLNGIFTAEEQDTYMELTNEGQMTKLLGYADNIQGTMEEECQMVTNGLYAGDASGYNDPRAEELRKDADKWILLFQLGSIDEASMMWGDLGRLYFWIKREDLESRKFDKSWCVFQCS